MRLRLVVLCAGKASRKKGAVTNTMPTSIILELVTDDDKYALPLVAWDSALNGGGVCREKEIARMLGNLDSSAAKELAKQILQGAYYKP
jgi:hypothetical protein